MSVDKSKVYALLEVKLVTIVNAKNLTINNQFNTKANDVTKDSNTPSNPF
ncbi:MULTISPECIES: hypothetical protein [Lactiplantibacillus]|nr:MULTISPECIES: hypothetical protein [Lactiplantibacillus]WNW17384.1 hypothetical protein RUO99_15360 [Lactiplantibacillus plantarum]WNW20305.1 hypothetical protein RUP00_15055 [Lactiplantibacillus plantarum]